MYRPILLGFLASFAVSGAVAQGPGGVEREIIQLLNDWTAAYQKDDVALIERTLADEYLITNGDGSTSDKAHEVADARAGNYKPRAFRYEDVKVRVFGDVAVATSRQTATATYKGKDASGVRRYTDVFVRRDGRWQAVTSQATVVQKP